MKKDQPDSIPHFDGRIKYYDAMGDLMHVVNRASCENEYRLWYTALSRMVDMNPFIKVDEIKKIDEAMKKAHKLLLKVDNAYLNEPSVQREKARTMLELQSVLGNCTRLVYQVMKRHKMLIPWGEEEGEDFDHERFLRESDL